MAAALKPGNLLIATVELDSQPEFRRAVILLLDYDAKLGAKGVIINHPLKEKRNLYHTDMLEELAADVDSIEHLFYQGGPVDIESLVCLHKQEAVGGTQVSPDIFATGDLELIRTQSATADPPNSVMRFYLGFSSWSPGQLEQEINSWESWILCPASTNLVFAPNPTTVWHQALYDLGGKYRPMSLIPEDLTVN